MTSSDRKAYIRMRMRNTGESYENAKRKLDEYDAYVLAANTLAQQDGISVSDAMVEVDRSKPFNSILVSFEPVEIELTDDQVNLIRQCPVDDYMTTIESIVTDYLESEDYIFPFGNSGVIQDAFTEGAANWDLKFNQRPEMRERTSD